MLLKPIPADELAGFQHKVFAAEALKGQRSEWGFKNRWDGDYLSKVFLFFSIVQTQFTCTCAASRTCTM